MRYEISPCYGNIPEWSFLSTNTKQHCVSKIFHWKGFIGKAHDVEFENNYTSDLVEKLLSYCHDSKVGKGRDTLYDSSVRYSKEISAENITLDPNFCSIIESVASELALQMKHPTKVCQKFFKMIVYKQGMFFKEHIDSPHSENMIFTLSVQLKAIDELKGGNLSFSDKELNLNFGSNEVGAVMFFHDQEHEVTKLEKGCKIVLIFDVIQTNEFIEGIIEENLNSFQEGIMSLRRKGFNKVGIQSSHLYIGDFPEYTQLKGIDRVFAKLAEISKFSVEIREVWDDKPKEVIQFFEKYDPSFKELNEETHSPERNVESDEEHPSKRIKTSYEHERIVKTPFPNYDFTGRSKLFAWRSLHRIKGSCI